MELVFVTAIGILAATLTSLSYIPQVRKALPSGATADLSLPTLVTLALGLALWIVYGAIQCDYVVMAANLAGFSLVAALMILKLRDRRHA